MGFLAIISPDLLRMKKVELMTKRATRSHPEGIRPAGRQGLTPRGFNPRGDKASPRGGSTRGATKKPRVFCLLFSAFCLLLPWFLASCALTGEQRREADDLRRQMKESERTQAELRRRTEELQNRFEMLETRMKTIQGLLKSLEARGIVEEGLVETPLAADKKVQEHDVIVPTASAAREAPRKETATPAPPAVKSPGAAAAPATSKPASPPLAPPTAEKSTVTATTTAGAVEPQKLYDEAYRTYSNGNSLRARGLFQTFYQKFPQDRLAPNALYWLGECYYDQRDYSEALGLFQKVVDLYPQSSKGPDALYKKGVCYLDLKQTSRAVEELRVVLNKYPQSNAAKLAREKLSGLGVGSSSKGK